MRIQQATLVIFLAAGVGSCAAVGQTTPAAMSTQATATDSAYVNGYNAGYGEGSADQSAGRRANAHKFQAYQQASMGYTASYGSAANYRSGFQSGFEDGYSDGFQKKARSLVPGTSPAAAAAPAAPAVAPPPAPIDPVVTARNNGYREGYSAGQADANHNRIYNAGASNAYQQAKVGFSTGLGSAATYAQNFRQAFGTGYDDGFNHRLFNRSLGGTTAAAMAAQAEARGSNTNDLPTDPERLRARPSGSYDNGLLVAEGTRIQATLDQNISTKLAQAGDAFTATVTVPVWVGATAAIPAGSVIHGTLQTVKRGGKLSGAAQITLKYDTVNIPGGPVLALDGVTVGVGAGAQAVDPSEGTVNGQNADTGKRAAQGAGMGAIMGGIFGGGRGLIRGGIAGAAIGTAGVLMTHNKDLELRQGEAIAVRLSRPLEFPPATPPGN